MCAGCDPESYTWPDTSSDGAAAEQIRYPLVSTSNLDTRWIDVFNPPWWMTLPPWDETS